MGLRTRLFKLPSHPVRSRYPLQVHPYLSLFLSILNSIHLFLFLPSSCFKNVFREFRDPQEIIDENPDGIFNSPDPVDRQEILDLPNYQKTDDNDRVPPIFDSQGNSIVRTEAFIDRSTPYAILQNLSMLPSILNASPNNFQDSNWDDQDSDNEIQDIPSSSVPYDVYPLAFTHNYGQYQAKGVPTLFNPIINDLSTRIKLQHSHSRNHNHNHPPRSRPDDDDQDDSSIHLSDSQSSNDDNDDPDDNNNNNDINDPRSAVLIPISSQGYNHLSHHVRQSTSTHIIQKGLLTATAAGAFASSKFTKQTASNLKTYCNLALPHNRYADILQAPRSRTNIDTSWRHECVYTLIIDNIIPNLRSGDAIFDNVISPLLSIYTKRSISNAIRSSFIIFKPNVSLFLYFSFFLSFQFL